MRGGRPARSSRPWGRAQRMLGVQQWIADVGGTTISVYVNRTIGERVAMTGLVRRVASDRAGRSVEWQAIPQVQQATDVPQPETRECHHLTEVSRARRRHQDRQHRYLQQRLLFHASFSGDELPQKTYNFAPHN